MLGSERQTLRNKLTEYEGNIPHMYLDSKYHVTVGIGHLLPTVAKAQKLPFIDEKTKKKATEEEIRADFKTISKLPRNPDPKKPRPSATFYKPHTKLILTQSDIEALRDSHIDSFYRELTSPSLYFTDFDRYPEEVRLALFDMIFNMGMSRLRTGWPNLNKAIKAQDWQKAAKESYRPGLGLRNEYVKNLFEKAAKHASKNKKP